MTEPLWPLSDERLRFYLRNRKRIEEWSALGAEVRQATLASFLDIQAPVDQLGVALGVEVSAEDARGDFPRWALRRPEWPLVGADTLVAVVLEAERRAIVADSESYAPYVGIRVGDPRGVGAAIRATLLPLGKQSDLVAMGYRPGTGPYWPLFRRVPASTGWWESADAWNGFLVNALSEAWSALAPYVDIALAGPEATIA